MSALSPVIAALATRGTVLISLGVISISVLVLLSMLVFLQCARGRARRSLGSCPRPQGLGGPAHLVVNVQVSA
jgi:MFS-type transporter involved in bile tolerance (Atg22 family)